MRIIALVFTLFGFYALDSQEMSGSSMEIYHEYRMKNSEPHYSLSKINRLISKLTPTYPSKDETQAENEKNYYLALSEKDFDKLSEKEKFTYIMINPEYRSQDYFDEIILSDEDKKIFGDLPPTINGATWSDRQRDFLKTNRNMVISLIKEYAVKDLHIGLNYKKALEEIKAKEAIPFLVDFYTTKDKKDKDILTLLLILVREGSYYPFVRSNIYRDLYGDKSITNPYIEYSPTNEDYVIKTATNYYSRSPKKRR